MTDDLAITLEDVRSAARQISAAAVRTPLLENRDLSERTGHRTLVKFEGAQHGGSFKFRGAYNRLARLDPAARAAGVVAWSSGNHAQGVALAAKILALPAAIVMPSDAPAIKIDNTRAFGAEVILYDRLRESREAIATRLAQERGATLVPSFDDPFIMAGQGTIGLELLEQASAVGADISQILVPCGGGGLISGIATAVKSMRSAIDLHAVEPEACDDTARSLQSGQRETNPAGASSVCDALLAPSPGILTLPVIRTLVTSGLTVSDSEVEAAMRFAFSRLKLVVEPGGAVALAAALAGKAPPTRGDRVLVLSGSNVDPALFAAILEPSPPDSRS